VLKSQNEKTLHYKIIFSLFKKKKTKDIKFDLLLGLSKNEKIL